MWFFFLKWYFTILLSSHEHLTARRQNVTSMTSLDIFALLSLFMNLVFWGQVAHEHFCNMTWVGYEMALLGAGRPTLPGPTNRGRYTAPPNRWFVQWQELKIVWYQLTIKLNPTICWNTSKWLTMFFLSNKILSRWKIWILEWTIELIVLDILTLVHFVLFANLIGLLHLKY